MTPPINAHDTSSKNEGALPPVRCVKLLSFVKAHAAGKSGMGFVFFHDQSQVNRGMYPLFSPTKV